VIKDYRRTQTDQPIWWKETVCAENNVHVSIGNEIYFLSGDSLLMPAKRGQPPPDLRYFTRPQKSGRQMQEIMLQRFRRPNRLCSNQPFLCDREPFKYRTAVKA